MAESNISSDWMDILDGNVELLMTWPNSRINILQAFEVTPFEEVKVVIIGEETWWWWRNKSQEDEIPPSMEIIFEELKSDFLHTPATYRCLKSWAKQGVLLLDVFQHDAGDDHDRAMAWEACIDNIFKKLNDREKQIAFILWGELAQSKSSLINSEKHLVLSARHPVSSYMDINLKDFSGSKPFSKTNEWINKHGWNFIDWRMPYITNDWQSILEGKFLGLSFQDLQRFLDKEYANQDINPDRELIFRALELTPFEKVKVVIMGNDPCRGKGQASGVAFSVPFGTEVPRSTSNIYDELKNDLDYAPVKHGCLESWAEQGVLLLNAVLTINQNKDPKLQSHRKAMDSAWTTFTDAIIKKLNERNNPIVFILWGELPRDKESLITNKQHMTICNDHPAFSFYSRFRESNFIGSKPFSRANQWLEAHGEKPIVWKLPSRF